MARGHTTERRYGPRWLLAARWCFTVLVALVALALFVSMVMHALADDPQVHAAAALVFFLLGMFALVMGPVTWGVWRPTLRWRRADRDGWLLQQRLNEQVRKEQLRAAALGADSGTTSVTDPSAPDASPEAGAATATAAPTQAGVDAAVPDAPVGGRHRGGRAHRAPAAPGEPRTQQLAVRGPEGQVVTLLAEGTGSRRAPVTTGRTAPAGPPVWPGRGTVRPDG